jgi:uncharacterized RDD family membrane protein YckC
MSGFVKLSDYRDAPPVAYARFGRRVRALLLDAIVVAGASIAILVLSEAAREVPGSGRVAVGLLFVGLLLYEPLLVSALGGTVGHRAVNLRVVADGTRGNPSFARAFARFWIKAMLGLPSFVAMAFTHRHQAVHDSLTGTTVQIRDLRRAAPEEYLKERVAPDARPVPSRARRVVVIAGYLLGQFVLLAVATGALLPAECVDATHCTPGQNLLSRVLGMLWIAAGVYTVIAGWRGQLWGGRATSAVTGISEPAV